MTSDLEKAWRRAAALPQEHALALPFPREHVAVVGTGLAAGVARAYAALRVDAGHGPTDALAVDDVPRATFDRAVLLSATGTEPEVIDVVGWLRSEAILAIALGAPPGSPLDELAGTTVPLEAIGGPGGGDAPFALTSLAVLRNHLLGATGARDAGKAMQQPLPDVSGVRRWVFVGRRWSLGLAEAAAVAFRRRGAQAVAGPPSALAGDDLGVLEPTTLVWRLDGSAPAALRGRPALRGATLDPAAELVLALRVAETFR